MAVTTETICRAAMVSWAWAWSQSQVEDRSLFALLADTEDVTTTAVRIVEVEVAVIVCVLVVDGMVVYTVDTGVNVVVPFGPRVEVIKVEVTCAV